MGKNKLVVYTCITGGYDTLREIRYMSPSIDYICFTDSPSLTSRTWKVLPLPKELEFEKSVVKKQRLVKILPHKWFPEHDASLWVDSNIEIISDLIDFFKKYDLSKKILYVNKHPSRDCLYREQLAVVRLNKDTFENTAPQINRYRDEGFPEHYGLAETNILLRAHNDKRCVKLMDLWAKEIKEGSHRDQLSFNYAIWKCDCKASVEYLDEKYYNLHLSDRAFFCLRKHIAVGKAVPREELPPKQDLPKKTDFIASFAKEAVEKEEEAPKLKAAYKAKPISVVVFTHDRTNVARETLKSLFKNLKYSGQINWILADDRSSNEHLAELERVFKEHGVKHCLCQTTKTRFGLGASMNIGLQKAFEKTDIVLRVEDDWILEKELSLDKFVKTLDECKNVAGIRIGMVGRVSTDSSLFKDASYKPLIGPDSKAWLFVNQVAIVHKRIHDSLGWYLENVGADRSEEEFRSRFNKATKNGREKWLLLAPAEMKWRTFDDPSLWFIHVGRSTLGHTIYREPKRYSWIYDVKKKPEVKLVAVKDKAPADKAPVSQKSVVDKKHPFVWPTISVMMTTHNRTAVASFVLDNLIKKLKYSGKIHWIVCDDRSAPGHLQVMESKFVENNVADYSILATDSKRWGLGASMNNGLKNAFKHGDVVLTTEDDWYLRSAYDIDSKVKILLEDKDVAGIRIGALCNELGSGLKADDKHREYCKLEAPRGKQGRFFIFNNQVMIRHKRAFDKIGYMKENCPPDVQEQTMVAAYNKLTDFGRTKTFKTLWPKDYDVATLYGAHNPFFHIGRSTIEGKNRPIRKDFTYLNNDKLDEELRSAFAETKVQTVFFKVVIPSYNVEKYITRCIESVEKQTFKNYHIVVADDMSTDRTRGILTDLQQKYKNLTVCYLQKKVCAGGARNAAMKMQPSSWYTIFLDADDYFIDNTAFQQICDCIKNNNNPDCVELSYEREMPGGATANVIARAKNVDDLLKQRVFAPWRKVIRSAVLKDFKADRLRANDVVWTFRQADATKTLVRIEKPLIHYSTSNPISGWNGEKKNKADLDKAIELLRKDLEEEHYKSKEVEKYRINEIRLIDNKIGLYAK